MSFEHSIGRTHSWRISVPRTSQGCGISATQLVELKFDVSLIKYFHKYALVWPTDRGMKDKPSTPFVPLGRRSIVRAGAIQVEVKSRVNFAGNTLFKSNLAGGSGGDRGIIR